MQANTGVYLTRLKQSKQKISPKFRTAKFCTLGEVKSIEEKGACMILHDGRKPNQLQHCQLMWCSLLRGHRTEA
jgi:hypothetical protein